jgi:hypothetical protein
MDPDPDPDPTPDQIPFFSEFKDAKNEFFLIFSYNLPAGTLSFVLKIYFFARILCKKFVLHALFQSTKHLYEKREVSGIQSHIRSRINTSD